MATIGRLRRRPPVDPRNGAPPRPNTPPSAPTTQAPGAAGRPVPDGPASAATPAAAAWPLGAARSPELAVEADIDRTLPSAVVAAARATRRRRPRRGRPLVRICFQIHRRIVPFLPVWAICNVGVSARPGRVQ